MVARLDVEYRVDDSNDQFTGVHSVAGAATITLTHGTYASLALLLAQIETQMDAAWGAQMDTNEVSGVVEMADRNGNNFSVTWTRPGLRDWLGYTGNLTGASSYSAPNQCIGTFVGAASYPWETVAYGWEWALKRFEGQYQTGGAIKLGKHRLWQVNAPVSFDDLAELRSVLAFMLAGARARWWRDTTVTTAWSFTNWNGFVNVRLHPEQAEYVDDWLSERNQLTELQVPLLFVVDG